MDWTRQIDIYCERTGPGLWAEPLNAVTNLAFLLAAVVMWRRVESRSARILCAILFAIGIGSGLFHTTATLWASVADTLPIGVFILVYLFLVNRDGLGLRWPWALAATALFFPFAAAVVPVIDRMPFVRISGAYWLVPLLLFAYGAGLWRGRPGLARGLVAGGLLLSVSITLRSLDLMLCATWGIGTHFLWHLLNAVMLGWMIHVHETRARRDGAVPGPGGA